MDIMKNIKATKGPWAYTGSEIVNKKREIITIISDTSFTHKKDIVNSVLMASSPVLLELLKSTTKFLHDCCIKERLKKEYIPLTKEHIQAAYDHLCRVAVNIEESL